MEGNQMKNIIVLKNLPSNLVEEAIVILKNKKISRNFEYIEKKETLKKEEKNKNDYIITEAENIISNYINNIEKKKEKKNDEKFNKKYKSLKTYSIIRTIILILVLFLK